MAVVASRTNITEAIGKERREKKGRKRKRKKIKKIKAKFFRLTNTISKPKIFPPGILAILKTKFKLNQLTPYRTS